MFTKNKQNKLRQMKKIEIREESYLKYTTIIKYAFCFRIFLFFISSKGIAPWSPIERTVVPLDSQLHFISQFMENEKFFPSWLTL